MALIFSFIIIMAFMPIMIKLFAHAIVWVNKLFTWAFSFIGKQVKKSYETAEEIISKKG